MSPPFRLPIYNHVKLVVINPLLNAIIYIYLMIQYSQPRNDGIAFVITTNEYILTIPDIIQRVSSKVELFTITIISKLNYLH